MNARPTIVGFVATILILLTVLIRPSCHASWLSDSYLDEFTFPVENGSGGEIPVGIFLPEEIDSAKPFNQGLETLHGGTLLNNTGKIYYDYDDRKQLWKEMIRTTVTESEKEHGAIQDKLRALGFDLDNDLETELELVSGFGEMMFAHWHEAAGVALSTRRISDFSHYSKLAGQAKNLGHTAGIISALFDGYKLAGEVSEWNEMANFYLAVDFQFTLELLRKLESIKSSIGDPAYDAAIGELISSFSGLESGHNWGAYMEAWDDQTDEIIESGVSFAASVAAIAAPGPVGLLVKTFVWTWFEMADHWENTRRAGLAATLYRSGIEHLPPSMTKNYLEQRIHAIYYYYLYEAYDDGLAGINAWVTGLFTGVDYSEGFFALYQNYSIEADRHKAAIPVGDASGVVAVSYSLQNPHVSPVAPVEGDMIDFTVDYRTTGSVAPSRASLFLRPLGSLGTPAEHPLGGPGQITSGSNPFSATVGPFAVEQAWEYWYEFDIPDWGSVRFPGNAGEYFTLDVAAAPVPTVGWRVEAIEITGVSSVVEPGDSISVGGAVVRNTSNPGNDYLGLEWQARLVDPNGTIVGQQSGLIGSLSASSPNQVTVDLANFTAGQAEGVYRVEFAIYPEVEEAGAGANNVAAVNVLVTAVQDPPQHYVFPDSHWGLLFEARFRNDASRAFLGYYPSSGYHTFGSAKYYVSGSIDNNRIKLYRNTTSDDEVINEGRIARFNNNELVYCIDVSNYFTGNEIVNYSEIAIGGRSVSFLTVPSGVVLSCLPGGTVNLVASTTMDDFRSSTPVFFGTNAAQFGTWFRNATTSSGGAVCKYEFRVPTNASPGTYRADVMMELDGNRVLLDNVDIRVLSPPAEISSVAPNPASAGQTVTVSGTNFGAAPGSLTLDGVAVSTASWNSTQVSFVVSPGMTSGNLRINGPGGPSAGAPFVVEARPKIVMEESAGVTLGIAGLDFGEVEVGGQTSRPLRILNSGSAALSVGNFWASPSSVFRWSALGSSGSAIEDFPVSIAPGDFIELAIVAAPSLVGNVSGSLVFDSNDPDRPGMVIPLSLAAVDTTPPVVRILSPLFLDGSTTRDTHTVRGTVSDLSAVSASCSLNGASPVRIAVEFGEFEIPDLVFPVGPNSLLVTATDSSSNIGSDELPFEVIEPPPAVRFDDWVIGQPSIPLNQRGRMDDPDGDGVVNALEMFHGSSPVDGASRGGLAVVRAGGGFPMTIRFQMAKGISPGVGEVKWSSNLQSWQSSGRSSDGVTVTLVEEVVDASHPDYDVIEVTAVVTEGNPSSLYLRLQVDVNAL